MSFRPIKVLKAEQSQEAISLRELPWKYGEMGLLYPSAQITKRDGQIRYEIIEPDLSKQEMEKEMALRKSLFYTLKPESLAVGADDAEVATRMLDLLKKSVDKSAYPKIGYYLVRDIVRYDSLTAFLDDPDIEDLSYSAMDQSVKVFHREYSTWLDTNLDISLEDADYLVQRIALKCGKSVSIAIPMLDAMSPEGYRVSITFSKEISPPGSTFSVRKPATEFWTLPELIVDKHMMAPEMGAALWYTLQNRGVVLVVGRPGTGKTTLMNSALTVLPTSWKMVTVEEIPEIHILHPNWLRLITRRSSTFLEASEKVEISLDKLLPHTLRVRPDIVSVGEVRTKSEIKEFIQAVAAGNGGITSMHAEDFDSLKARFNYADVDDSFFSLVTFVLFLNAFEVRGKLIRRVQEMGEVVLKDGKATYNSLATYNLAKDSYVQNVYDSVRMAKLASINGLSKDDLLKDLGRRKDFIGRSAPLKGKEFVEELRQFYG
jgi:flagellar protein FlaI